jgi:hypothetical protein
MGVHDGKQRKDERKGPLETTLRARENPFPKNPPETRERTWLRRPRGKGGKRRKRGKGERRGKNERRWEGWECGRRRKNGEFGGIKTATCAKGAKNG